MNNIKIYKRHRFPPEIISHCVWLYYCFSLSYRDIELMMHQKGIIVTYESVRYWCIKFGKLFAQKLRKKTSYGDRYHLDEVFCRINGKWVYLWRAVDQKGTTVDILLQNKRNKKAARHFLKRVRKQGRCLHTVVTDKFKSYRKPCKEIFPETIHTVRIIERRIFIKPRAPSRV